MSSIAPLAGPISSSTSNAAHHAGEHAAQATPAKTKPQQKAESEPTLKPVEDKVKLSFQLTVSTLSKQGENPAQIAAQLGLSVNMVKGELAPTEIVPAAEAAAFDALI